MCCGAHIGCGHDHGVGLGAIAVGELLSPQPLNPNKAPRDRTVAASATARRGICRSRLRTVFMPANGSSKNPSTTGGKGPPEKGFSLRAVWLLLVWMVSVTGVAALPAGMVEGEKVAVAPGETGCAKGQRIGVGCCASR